MIAHGSAFPVAKLALNNSVPPILMASLRMGLVFLLLIPFWKFKLPNKKFFKPLILFSISMGVLVYVFMNLSLFHSSIIAPIILGSQLAIPFGILASAFLLNENISKNKYEIYSGPLHIISFLPKGLTTKETDFWTQTKVNQLMKNNFMLSRPKFKDKYFLRVVMGNYNTKESHIEELLKFIDS